MITDSLHNTSPYFGFILLDTKSHLAIHLSLPYFAQTLVFNFLAMLDYILEYFADYNETFPNTFIKIDPSIVLYLS